MKELIYKMIDFFTFGKGLKKNFYGYEIRLPTRYINYFPADYEPGNFNFLKEQCKKNDVILDIGAHIGLFATVAAKIVGPNGKVIAFEPAPKTNALLQQTISINKLQGIVQIRNEAMGKQVGKTIFFISEGDADNSNSMVSYLHDRKLHSINVTVLTVDDFIKQQQLNKVDFIKIDVEGAEYDTLQGATFTLKNLRPACILAIHPEPITVKGDKLEDIYELIHSMDYHINYEGKSISKVEFCNNKKMIDLHLLPM
jgi:FkbM family methyltransferase